MPYIMCWDFVCMRMLTALTLVCYGSRSLAIPTYISTIHRHTDIQACAMRVSLLDVKY